MAAVPQLKDVERERRITVVGALIAMLLAAIDQASVAPAVSIIGADLGNTTFLPWVVAAYFVTATAVTTLYGKIADLQGRRFALFSAIGVFMLGSIVSAGAPDIGTLVAGRAIQGIGGGGLLVLAQTIVGDVVPPAERGRYIAYISGAWAFASIAGPVMGGVIAEHVHWRAVFLVNLPLGVFALAICNGPLKRLAWQRREHSLDLLGALLVVTATVLLMLALTWGGPSTGWLSFETKALAGAASLVVALFVLRLKRAAEPLIPLDVLGNRSVAAATVGAFFVMASYTGLTVFLPIYLQSVHGLSISLAGLALIAFMIGAVLGSLISGRIGNSIRAYRRGACLGLAASALCLLVLAAAPGALHLAVAEVLILVTGIGLGANFPATTVAVQNAVDVRDLGAATGVLQFLRSLGSAIGIAALGAAAAVSGIGAGLLARGTAPGPVNAVTIEGASFAPVFILAAVGAVIGLLCLLLIEDKPLRGR
jgi:EmrB/QacA subfamily drug resistance transporter